MTEKQIAAETEKHRRLILRRLTETGKHLGMVERFEDYKRRAEAAGTLEQATAVLWEATQAILVPPALVRKGSEA